MTSPPALLASAHQVAAFTEFLMNFTDPSRKAALTPPEWYELVLTMVYVLLASRSLKKHALVFGGMTWLYPPPFAQFWFSQSAPFCRWAEAVSGVPCEISPAFWQFVMSGLFGAAVLLE